MLTIPDVAVFLCVSGREKDGKIVQVIRDSNLYKDMKENSNYQLQGYTDLKLNESITYNAFWNEDED